MNDDAKKKLKEKLGSLVSDEDLDNVAGGTYAENLEILNAMAKIDPQGVQSIFSELKKYPDRVKKDFLDYQTNEIINKNFGNDGVHALTLADFNNMYYTKNNQPISHSEMLKMINDKALEKDGWEVG